MEADEASRVFKDELEWTLNADDFQNICAQFGRPTIDLFASRLNFQVQPFCAYHPDPLASVIDAFTFPWTNGLGYAFPPFCLLGRILQKVLRDKADIILIVPDWPTKAWYPLFKRLLILDAICIPVMNDTLFLPHRVRDPTSEEETHTQEEIFHHPMSGQLRLLVGRLSGNV